MSKHIQHFGKMTYEIEGIQKEFVGDLYHTLMRSSWWSLLLAAFGLYVGSAILFAFLLSLGPGHVQDANNYHSFGKCTIHVLVQSKLVVLFSYTIRRR